MHLQPSAWLSDIPSVPLDNCKAMHGEILLATMEAIIRCASLLIQLLGLRRSECWRLGGGGGGGGGELDPQVFNAK